MGRREIERRTRTEPDDEARCERAVADELIRPWCCASALLRARATSSRRRFDLKKGANYGWPIKEGDPGAGYARPLAVWDRRAYAKAAVCGGPIVTSGPLAGNALWGDLVTGRIFYTATDPSGIVKPFYELQLSTPLFQLAGGDTRCDMRMGLGSNGEIFITTKTDGFVRELAVL